MESIKEYFTNIKKPVVDVVTSIIAGTLCATNLAFMFAMNVLIVMMCVNIIITLFYQSALPVSVAASFGSVALAAVAFPWLAAIIATVVDWSRWPVSYTRLREGLRQLFGLQPRRHALEQRENIRRLIFYSAPLVIWITSSAVGIAGGSQRNAGTVLFIVLALVYILLNAFYDVVRWKANDVDSSALLFVLFGNRRGVFAMVALCLVFLTTIANVSQNESIIEGGKEAIACSFVLTPVYFCFHFGIYLSKTRFGSKEFVARSTPTYIIAGIELVSLLASGICVAIAFDGSDSVGVWLFFTFVLITYSTLYWRDIHVDLNDLTTSSPSASSPTDPSSPVVVALSHAAASSSVGGIEQEIMKPQKQNQPAQQQQQQQKQQQQQRVPIGSSPSSDTQRSLHRVNLKGDAEQRDNRHQKVDGAVNDGDDDNDRHQQEHSLDDGDDDDNNGDPTCVSRCSGFDYDDDQRRKATTSSISTRASECQGTNEKKKITASNDASLVEAFIHDGDDGDALNKSDAHAAKRESRVGQRTTVKRISYVICTLTCLVVFASSLINTSGDNRAIRCPGIYPGTNASNEKFSVCQIHFNGGLAISDFAALAAASYFKTGEFYRAMDVYFPGENVSVIGGSEFNTTRQQTQFVGVRFFSVRFPLRNVSIVVTRGSALSIDWEQDIVVGSDVASLRLGTALLPVMFSDDLEATLVDVMSALKFGMKSYANPVRDEVVRIKAAYPDDFHYQCGHSLGGWATNIVGAQTGTKTVAFSPVGTGLQRKRFDFTWKVANEVITSVIPAIDIVPKVDIQLGSVQNIVSVEKCSPKNALCHSMVLTQTTLALNCGDPLGRRSIKVTDDIPQDCFY